jgi:shikimate dehydrogenase/3-dehydroquinate dehydratase type I
MDWIVSLTPEVSNDPLAAIATPPDGAAVVELRADLFTDIDLRAAVSACPLPVLVTLRSTTEGGRGPDDPGVRRQILAAARDAGAALIDLEHARDARLADELGLAPEQVVLSWHDPGRTPHDLEQTAAELLAGPSRIVKIIPTAASLADLERLLAVHRRFNGGPAHKRRLIAFAMGTVGVASRYLAPLLGPPLSFAAWTERAAAAPGQLTIPRLESVIGHLQAPPQRLFGVIGADVGSSLSPVLHGAAYRELGLPYLMLPISVPDEAELVELITYRGETLFDRFELPAHGWAVTTPYKAIAAAAADITAPRVRTAGAANTLTLRDTAVAADNTDADGIVGSLKHLDVDPVGRPGVIQGTGGAARGAAVGLYLAGTEVALRGRDGGRTRAVAEEIGVAAIDPGAAAGGGAVLVNATPLGSRPDDRAPFTDAEISGAAAVIDMVYADHETGLISRAKAAGVPAADGRIVLAHQAFAQFAAFTGQLPPKDVMLRAVEM